MDSYKWRCLKCTAIVNTDITIYIFYTQKAYQSLAHTERQQAEATYTNQMEQMHHLRELERERTTMRVWLIISPNEVFGDIMVLASLLPRPPPLDPDDVNTITRKIFNLSLSNFIYGWIPP